MHGLYAIPTTPHQGHLALLPAVKTRDAPLGFLSSDLIIVLHSFWFIAASVHPAIATLTLYTAAELLLLNSCSVARMPPGILLTTSS